MEIQEFIAKMEAAFPENASRLEPGTRFKELSDWNSLTALFLVTTASREYNVDLDPSALYEAETIQDLYDLIKNKL